MQRKPFQWVLFKSTGKGGCRLGCGTQAVRQALRAPGTASGQERRALRRPEEAVGSGAPLCHPSAASGHLSGDRDSGARCEGSTALPAAFSFSSFKVFMLEMCQGSHDSFPDILSQEGCRTEPGGTQHPSRQQLGARLCSPSAKVSGCALQSGRGHGHAPPVPLSFLPKDTHVPPSNLFSCVRAQCPSPQATPGQLRANPETPKRAL